MEYSPETVRKAAGMMMFLQRKMQIIRGNNTGWYEEYEQQAELRDALDDIADGMDCQIIVLKDSICLIPNRSNTYLGYTMREIRDLTGAFSNRGVEYTNLAQFVQMVLIRQLYGSEHPGDDSSLIRDSISFADFQNAVTDALNQGMTLSEEEENGYITYKELYNTWDSLENATGKSARKKKDTKEAIINGVLSVLSRQNLISYSIDEEIIAPTERLTQLVDNVLLNQENYHIIMDIFRQVKEEQILTESRGRENI